jgi:hypothetical protein
VRSQFVVWWVQLLTSATFRLNSRDHVRERPATDRADNNASGFNMTSFRIGQWSEADQFRLPVSVTVPHSVTMDFPQGKRDQDVESTAVDISKSVRSLQFFATLAALVLNLFVEGGEHSL